LPLLHGRGSVSPVLSSRDDNAAIFPLTIYNSGDIVDSREESFLGKPTDLVHGTLDLLILKTISLEPMNGWGIAKRITQISNDVLQVQQGSLYPALHRLEHQGWIKAEWKDSENNRRAKFYSLSVAGRKQLKSELAHWQRLSSAIGLVIDAL
jgi:PadR family transcriptional regulator PadR